MIMKWPQREYLKNQQVSPDWSYLFGAYSRSELKEQLPPCLVIIGHRVNWKTSVYPRHKYLSLPSTQIARFTLDSNTLVYPRHQNTQTQKYKYLTKNTVNKVIVKYYVFHQ